MRRISKDEYYLQIAKAVAKRSICIESRWGFGAIIVTNDTIVSTGYAGPARGVVNCNEVGGCSRNILKLNHNESYENCPSVHAEENVIVNAARHGSKVFDGIMFAIGVDNNGKVRPCLPCPRCKRILINAGIREVVTMGENGNIIKYNVKDWVEEDSKAYTESLKKIKNLN
jgi:dCMP deaminase